MSDPRKPFWQQVGRAIRCYLLDEHENAAEDQRLSNGFSRACYPLRCDDCDEMYYNTRRDSTEVR